MSKLSRWNKRKGPRSVIVPLRAALAAFDERYVAHVVVGGQLRYKLEHGLRNQYHVIRETWGWSSDGRPRSGRDLYSVHERTFAADASTEAVQRFLAYLLIRGVSYRVLAVVGTPKRRLN